MAAARGTLLTQGRGTLVPGGLSTGAEPSVDPYTKYHVVPGDERRELFRLLSEEFACRSGLYPGSFVHVTPSFYFSTMIYVDLDPQALHFFRGGTAGRLVRAEKIYDGEAEIRFLHRDYMEPLPMEDESVDLLISQYASFVSEACARYLRRGGILVANDSHGDAGLARCDAKFELIGAVHRLGQRFRLQTTRLDDYFVRASGAGLPARSDLRDYLKGLGRGLSYMKTADHYLFLKREEDLTVDRS